MLRLKWTNFKECTTLPCSLNIKKSCILHLIYWSMSSLLKHLEPTLQYLFWIPAYLNKFGVARKAPNFKNIHQKLFENMESLGDNHKRKLERAHDLLQSPAPRVSSMLFVKFDIKFHGHKLVRTGPTRIIKNRNGSGELV